METNELFYAIISVLVVIVGVLGFGSRLIAGLGNTPRDVCQKLNVFIFCVALLYLFLFVISVSWGIGWGLNGFSCLLEIGIPLLLIAGVGIWVYWVFRQIWRNGFSQKLVLPVEPARTKEVLKSTDDRILGQLLVLFEKEMVYREADLHIGEIARRIGTNRTYVSAVINRKFGLNFGGFVNGYRIREAQYLMGTTGERIKVIAELVGFNSISAFNASFKEYCGQSPTVWRKNR